MATRTITTKLALDGEAEYKAKLKNINAELSLHKSELEKVQAQYKTSANSMEALTAKQTALKGQLDALNQKHAEQSAMLEKAKKAQQEYASQAEELRVRLDALKNSSTATVEEEEKLTQELAKAEQNMQKAANSVTFYQKQLNLTERDQANLSSELEQTGQYLNEAADSADGCAKSIDAYGREVKDAGEESQKFGNTSKEAIEQLASVLAAAGVAKTVKEIADALMECVDTFASFQSQMSTVQAISGASASQMQELAEKAKYMGSTTSFTATEAGQALEYMAMAGWKTEDMLGGLEGVMYLASASGEDLASTSDIVTDALTAFGLAASDSAHFADVLAAASSNSNTNVGMMGETFKYAAPVAGALGYSIEDTALAIGLMANSMIKGGEAGTALRGMLTNLSKPSKEVSAYMEKLGISLTDSTGSVRSLSDLMGILRERFSELTEAEKAEYAAGLAGKEAMSGLLAVVNASEADYQKLTAAINTCNGSAKEMSEIRLDNYAGQMTLLGSAADGLKLAVGEQLTPALTELAKVGTDAFVWATDVVTDIPLIVPAIVGVTTATAALTAGVMLYKHETELAAAKTAILNAVMDANPAVFIVAGIIGVATAIGTYVASMDAAADETEEFNDALKETKDSYEELMDTMAAEQASTRAVADSLKELLAVEEKSAVQKDLIQQKVDQLNEAVPELGLAYDREKDALVGLTEAELDAALASAAAQETYAAQVEHINELTIERTELQTRLTEAQERLTEAEMLGGEAVANAQQKVDGLKLALQGNAAALDAATQEAQAYAEQQSQTSHAVQEMDATVGNLITQMDDLMTAYDDSYSAAMKSIDSQLGLFKELDGTAKTSIGSLIDTLKGQVEYMETYSANIQKAMELGVDEGLVRKLSDGKEESAQILAAIVSGGEEDIQALNAEFRKVEEGKESFSTTVADMETDFSNKMTELVRDLDKAIQDMNVQDDAYRIGENNIQGLINGTASKRQQLVYTYAQMGRDALAAYKREVGQASPSKKFHEAGRFDVQGIIGGAEEEKTKLDATYEQVAQAALNGMKRHLPSTIMVPSATAALDRQINAIVNAVSVQEDRGSSFPIYIDKLEVRNDSDVDLIARKLYGLAQREGRSRGGGGL